MIPEIRRNPETEERVQAEYELSRAYDAAKALEERLELAGLNGLARTARLIRDELALYLMGLR
ncbi:MAG: hypothetical protein V4515_12235 [Chloroflexota bacterium]